MSETHGEFHALMENRALQLRREARMVSLAMGAAMMGTVYFLWARCAQHGGSVSGGGLVCVSLRSYRALMEKCYLSVFCPDDDVIRTHAIRTEIGGYFQYDRHGGWHYWRRV